MKENLPAEQAVAQGTGLTMFGFELLRGDLLPELLGKDSPEILYWAGKRLARKYPLNSLDEIKEFFVKASWGTLELITENKNELEIEMASPFLASRVKSKADHFFQLEAGFLAQQIESINKAVTEAFEHPVKKGHKILFTIKWDKRDTV